MENTSLFVIHGAWSTSNTFNCLVNTLKDTPVYKFDYDCHQYTLSEIVKQAKKALTKINGSTIIIGHSLGGIIALSLEQEPSVKKIITVASPIAGLKFPKLAEAFLSYRAPIISDIVQDSRFMINLKKKKFTKEIKILVSNMGYNPMILEKNDGVVTFSSQTSWVPNNADIIHIDANHHEILQTKEFIETVTNNLG